MIPKSIKDAEERLLKAAVAHANAMNGRGDLGTPETQQVLDEACLYYEDERRKRLGSDEPNWRDDCC